jgi:hypothetical protein
MISKKLVISMSMYTYLWTYDREKYNILLAIFFQQLAEMNF